MINYWWVDGKLISWGFDKELYEFKNVCSWRNKKPQQDFVDVSVENEFWPGITYPKMGWEIYKI